MKRGAAESDGESISQRQAEFGIEPVDEGSTILAHGGMLVRMNSNSEGRKKSKIHLIELKLRELRQLFNTMDPSPFKEKDLDREAEEFIMSWARDYPLEEPVR